MKPVSFNEQTDHAPLPFDRRVLTAAHGLKSKGLAWRPHVGCFVWDRQKIIPVPSPFPLDVFFILSLPRFLAIFGNMEKMQSDLVWVPTWHQGLLLCREMSLDTSGLLEGTIGMAKPGDELLALYERIAKALPAKIQSFAGGGTR